MSLLSSLNLAPRKLVPNTWRNIISCMSIVCPSMKGIWYLWTNSYTYTIWNPLPTMGITSFCLGIGILGSSLDFLLLFVIGSHDTSLFLALDGKPYLTTFGWSHLLVHPFQLVFSLSFYWQPLFHICDHLLDACFVASKRLSLKSCYQSRVQATLEFTCGIDDFDLVCWVKMY